MQAAGVLSILYSANMKSNSITSYWSDKDWTQSMTYIGVDLGVEMVVFAGTVFALKHFIPSLTQGGYFEGC